MLNLYAILKNRLNETRALPLSTYPKNIKNDKGENVPNADRTHLEQWCAAVEDLRVKVFAHVVNGTAAQDDIFTAWKACLAFFPESMTGKRARPDADDYAALCSLATNYRTRSKEDRADGKQAKTWTDASAGTFRKAVEDLAVNRIDNTQFKDLDTLNAERQAKRDAQEARRKARIAEVMEAQHCNEETAKKIIKMLNAQKKADAAKADAANAKKAVETAKKLDAAKAAQPAEKKTAKKTAAKKTTKAA